MAAATALMLGGAAGAGALAGGIRGKQGQRDQTQQQFTTLAPMSEQEQQLFNQSINQYNLAQGQQMQLEQRLRGLEPLQQQAMQGYQDILGGGAFNVNPQEQALLDQIRQQSIGQSEADLNRFLDERMNQVLGSAGARGLRGQALTSMQGDVLKEAAAQQANAIRQADMLRSQSMLQLPYQRISAQSPFLQQGMSMADQLRQQAFQNRMALQDPTALQMMRSDRYAQANQTQFTPGYKGSWLDAFTGGLTGGLQGGAIGANMIGAFQGMGGGGGGAGAMSGGAMGGGGAAPAGQQINYGMFGRPSPYTR